MVPEYEGYEGYDGYGVVVSSVGSWPPAGRWVVALVEPEPQSPTTAAKVEHRAALLDGPCAHAATQAKTTATIAAERRTRKRDMCWASGVAVSRYEDRRNCPVIGDFAERQARTGPSPYDAGVTEQDRTDARLKTLQGQLDELREARPGDRQYAAFAGLAGALAVAMVVLSTGTWFTEKSHTYSAWEQPEDINWFGYVAVILLFVLATASIVVVRLDGPGHLGHWLVAFLAGLTAACVLVLAAQVPREGNLHTAPAYWFTIVAAIGLALAHGYRGDHLSKNRRY